MEEFQYATSLDLNMGYYHIEITPASSALCTILLPWGKYKYLKLPMGLCNNPNIFQEKMSEMFMGIKEVRVYIDDLLLITMGSWKNHLEKLDEVLDRSKCTGLKVNAQKSLFSSQELECLGHWVTKQGVKPLQKNVEAILKIVPPTTRKKLCSYIGMINYYRDMWQGYSKVLAPLIVLTSKMTPWKWTSVEQKAFKWAKKIVFQEMLLA
eukprot:6697293-Ditylum_brightwellii.AAC.1